MKSPLRNIFAADGYSVSNPNDPRWWFPGGGGRRTRSGEFVTPEGALALSTYYGCIRNIAEDLSKLPKIVYRRLGETGKERRPDHPAYRLLHDAPNAETTPIAFGETITAHAVGWGGGFAEIERDRGDRPIALHQLHPSRVKPERLAGQLAYKVYREGPSGGISTQWDWVPARNMLHIHGLGGDGVTGYSVAQIGAESIGLGQALQTFSAAFFGNGLNPGGIYKHPQTLSDPAYKRLQESLVEEHGGAKHAFLPMILEEGMDYVANAVPPDQAQFIQSREFSVEDIARWFRMSLSKLQHYKRAQGWSTLEALNTDYALDCLLPWAVRWEQECKRKLFGAGESDYFVEILFDMMLRVDARTRTEIQARRVQTGLSSPNEVRAMDNQSPYAGGESYWMPRNLAPVSQLLSPPKPAPAAGAGPAAQSPRKES